MLQAAIDLGTVTSRLMIGEVEQGRIEVLERKIIITNLGEGLTSTGVISDTAYARLLAALLDFRETITDVKTQLICEGQTAPEIPMRIVATSAMRDAQNASQILEQLSDLGFEVEIISGNREAELSFKGTLSGFTDLKGPLLSIDVGGGSTELILGTEAAELLASHSFDIGSRRITEMFLPSDPPGNEEMSKARAWIRQETEDFFASLPGHPLEVFAVAGAATSALTMRDRIAEYDSTLVHGKRMTHDELEDLIYMLAAMNLDQRRQVAGLHPDRAPVIIGGLITLVEMLKSSQKDTLLVSGTDILQGIMLDEPAIC